MVNFFAKFSSHGKFSLIFQKYRQMKFKKIKTEDLFPIKNDNDLKKKIRFLGPWFHQIDLNGIKTRDIYKTDSPSTKRGYHEDFTEQDYIDNPLWIWTKFKDKIPNNLNEKRGLDIGCNCGFYSIELAKRGANVIGIDYSYSALVQANFAKQVLELHNITFQSGNITNLEETFKTKFDIILCLGLLYHIQDPEAAIKSVSKITDYAIFETLADYANPKSELVQNHPSATPYGILPTTNWLKDTFKQYGFKNVEEVTRPDFGRHVFICKK